MQIPLTPVAQQADSSMRLAKIKYQQQDYQGAIAAFDRVIEIDPYSAIAYHQRSFVYYRLEDYDRALADCDRAISYNSEMAVAYANRGFINRSIPDRYSLASSDWRVAAQLFKQKNDLVNYERMMELVRNLNNEDTWGNDILDDVE
jgi:tetratricopeptide (TPR) repeat protein